jgi:glutamate/tyrosine decarboxylase-like PLP-dependent enzyme
MSDARKRNAPIEMTPEQFRRLGYQAVDKVAALIGSMYDRKVCTEISPNESRALINSEQTLPLEGTDSETVLNDIFELLEKNSLYNSHPKFWGYITSSAAPIGIIGDLLAAGLNQNVGAWKLSPVATEIEAQAVRWISQLLGYPTESGGILVSGGNMANFVGFLAARASVDWDIRKDGFQNERARKLTAYVSAETHTWVQKAADLFGLGTDSIRWIKTDTELRMKIDDLKTQIASDRKNGYTPFLVVGTAGSVSTGAIDPLHDIASLCKNENLWFHIDGAYGAFAAAVPKAPKDLMAFAQADSIAVDPHKWLYAPLEAGCALVKDAEKLRYAFSYHPPYYHFGEEAQNFVDYGMQNSRGFRALKVWLALKQVGRSGYEQMIAEDIRLAKLMFDLFDAHDQFEAVTYSLSIATFRYVPSDLRAKVGQDETEKYLNELNEQLLFKLEKSGEAYVSNAIVGGRFLLRGCIVNFRTSEDDVRALPEIIGRLAQPIDKELRSR